MTETTDTKAQANWFIAHTYSGQEDRVKKNLELRIDSMDAKGKIFEVVVPTEEEIAIKDGKRRSLQRKIFPGYILVHMVMDDETWHVVRNTPGVTGFVSSEDERERRPRPSPLTQQEVDAILNRMVSPTPRVRVGLSNGDVVRITGGPFAEFMGSVDYVDQDKGKVRVMVSFFGRETPVELDFLQVEKV